MNSNERYARQVALKEWGERGQARMSSAKVLVVGAGGLGCPALLYLSACGTGCIGIADDDRVVLSNLHRQVLFTAKDVGRTKVEVAKERIEALNPEVRVVMHEQRLTNQNALEIIEPYDIVIDGTDNFPSKYVLSDACALRQKPLVYGSVSRFEGQVALLNARSGKAAACHYRDLFPQPPPEKILNCTEEGVLGSTTGIIGTLQAQEAIKWLAGIGTPLVDQLLVFDGLTGRSSVFGITKRKENLLPADEDAFMNTDYEWFCAPDVEEIDALQLKSLLREEGTVFIDVREPGEQPAVDFNHVRMPLPDFRECIQNIEAATVVCFCQTGKRSRQAARMLVEQYGTSKKIYSLRGGVLSLQSKPDGHEA